MLNQSLTFDDVLLIPAPLSYIKSRADVDTSTELCGKKYKLGLISSNMDSVYSPELARETARMGGISVVHRFCNIETNIKLFKNGIYQDIKPWCSIGSSLAERERAIALVDEGCQVLVLDVALGANIEVVKQAQYIRERFGNKVGLVVGNFATSEQLKAFHQLCNSVDLYKLSIGSGSACVTSTVTGVGIRSFSCLQDCVSTGLKVIFDGGINNTGNFCKALAGGASAVMVGKIFAACEESPNEVLYDVLNKKLNKRKIVTSQEFRYDPTLVDHQKTYKKYRGSASLESYEVQGKVAKHRVPEGEAFLVEVTGKVEDLMQKYEGALRSSMSYLNANNLTEYVKNANFVQVTQNGIKESGAHGKRYEMVI